MANRVGKGASEKLKYPIDIYMPARVDDTWQLDKRTLCLYTLMFNCHTIPQFCSDRRLSLWLPYLDELVTVLWPIIEPYWIQNHIPMCGEVHAMLSSIGRSPRDECKIIVVPELSEFFAIHDKGWTFDGNRNAYVVPSEWTSVSWLSTEPVDASHSAQDVMWMANVRFDSNCFITSEVGLPQPIDSDEDLCFQLDSSYDTHSRLYEKMVCGRIKTGLEDAVHKKASELLEFLLGPCEVPTLEGLTAADLGCSDMHFTRAAIEHGIHVKYAIDSTELSRESDGEARTAEKTQKWADYDAQDGHRFVDQDVFDWYEGFAHVTNKRGRSAASRRIVDVVLCDIQINHSQGEYDICQLFRVCDTVVRRSTATTKGGHLILKVNGLFEHEELRDMLFSMAASRYQKVFLCKPYVSRASSYEGYLLCSGRRAIRDVCIGRYALDEMALDKWNHHKTCIREVRLTSINTNKLMPTRGGVWNKLEDLIGPSSRGQIEFSLSNPKTPALLAYLSRCFSNIRVTRFSATDFVAFVSSPTVYGSVLSKMNFRPTSVSESPSIDALLKLEIAPALFSRNFNKPRYVSKEVAHKWRDELPTAAELIQDEFSSITGMFENQILTEIVSFRYEGDTLYSLTTFGLYAQACSGRRAAVVCVVRPNEH
jgi:23S rRNA U2552 (ribose-2'-O)-methylase RlmE/FtsJ